MGEVKGKSSAYFSKHIDAAGRIDWTEAENRVWQTLIERQMAVVKDKACQPYLDGLALLQLPMDRIPQLNEVSQVLTKATGWRCEPVPALISFDRFFELLAQKAFPVATFIRHQDELDYLQEPDIFHEIFGHCAMLTHPAFAKFTQIYGELGLQASKQDRVFLARLYWFTVEFGLLSKAGGCRSTKDKDIEIYGGGILSSIGETQYAYSQTPIKQPFDLLSVLRTPYRIDIMQPIYYVLDSIDSLYEISELDIMSYVEQAKQLGLFEPLFPVKAVTT